MIMKFFWFFLPFILLYPLIGLDSSFYLLRLSRVLTAFFVGGGLCLLTLNLQNITRNPLASEYTLGISAGASFTASLGLILGFSPAFFGMLGGIGSTLLLFFFLRKKLKSSSLILFGILLNVFFSSGIYFLNYLTSFKVSQSLSRWVFGGFSFYSFQEVVLISFSAFVLLVFSLREHPKIALLGIAEIYEEILGRAFRKKLFLLFLLIGFFITLSITLSGPLPFFALLFANFFRLATKGNPVKHILFSFFGGGFFLTTLDTFGRWINPLEEIPIGIITGILGLPFMAFLIFKEKP